MRWKRAGDGWYILCGEKIHGVKDDSWESGSRKAVEMFLLRSIPLYVWLGTTGTLYLGIYEI